MPLSPKKKDEPSRPSRKRAVLRWIFQPGRLVVLAILASAPLWIPTLQKVLPELTQRDEYQFDPRQIEINEPPHWAPHNLVQQVVTRAKLGEKVSLLDESLTERFAHAFARHPWVAGVVEVRKQPFPARVTTRLVYREPVGLVEKRSGFYPVDVNGIVLPSEDFSLAETAEYMKIRGVISTPTGTQGTSWGDPLVVGAARIAVSLRNDWRKLGLSGVRAPERTTAEVDLSEALFVLETSGGSQILWGRAPGIDKPGELSVEQKIGRLHKYVNDYGSFDEPAGPYEIDIRHWQQISRKKLNATRDARKPTTLR